MKAIMSGMREDDGAKAAIRGVAMQRSGYLLLLLLLPAASAPRARVSRAARGTVPFRVITSCKHTTRDTHSDTHMIVTIEYCVV